MGFSSPVSGGAAGFLPHLELLQRDLLQALCPVKRVEIQWLENVVFTGFSKASAASQDKASNYCISN